MLSRIERQIDGQEATGAARWSRERFRHRGRRAAGARAHTRSRGISSSQLLEKTRLSPS